MSGSIVRLIVFISVAVVMTVIIREVKNEYVLPLTVVSVVFAFIDLAIFSPLALVGFLVGLVFLRKKYFYSVKVKVLTSLAFICVILFIAFVIWICVECGIVMCVLLGNLVEINCVVVF